jgi:hypothetical protein
MFTPDKVKYADQLFGAAEVPHPPCCFLHVVIPKPSHMHILIHTPRCKRNFSSSSKAYSRTSLIAVTRPKSLLLVLSLCLICHNLFAICATSRIIASSAHLML